MSVAAGLSGNDLYISVSALASISFAAWVASRLRKPVIRLAEKSTSAAAGDFEIRIDDTWPGEIGLLASSIKRLINHVKDEIAISQSIKLGMETPLFTANTDTVVTYINRAASELMHVTPDQVVGKVTVKELFGSDKATRSALAGIPMPNYSVDIVNWSKETIPVIANSGPIRKSNGEIVGSFLVFFDMRKTGARQQEYLEVQIKPIADAVKEVSAGNLAARVDVPKDSQLVALAGEIEEMIDNLRLTMLDISATSSSVAASTTQISSSTEELAAGVQEQSAQTTEVAAAVEEMTKTVFENSRNATLTADVAKNNGELAWEGSDVVIQTVKKIREIAEVVQNSASTVERLGTSTQEIGEIVLVIDDIADQTNLLALNAAIEAARAGEEGRGFAVVADEVRKLAERTTQATKQIATMIKNVQKEAADAVDSMKRGSKEVAEGVMLADNAGNSLTNIVKDTQRVVDMMMHIAAASEEQSATSEQISKNVEAISGVSGHSANGISQIASATENLNRLADNLLSMVNRFNTGTGHSDSGILSHSLGVRSIFEGSARER